MLLVAALLGAARAEAQWNGFVNINGGVQAADRILTNTLEETVYDETATYTATMTSPGGTVVDAWAGARLWGNLGIGLGATVLNASSEISLEGSVPSPLFHSRHRSATLAPPGGLKHQQVGLHLALVYMVPVSERTHVALSAGPSLYRLRHDAPDTVHLSPEVAPFDVASLTGFTTAEHVPEGDGIGYNAGVDVTYLLYRWIGVGLYLRYTWGRVEIEMPGGLQEVDVGGAQAGAGFRFRF